MRSGPVEIQASILSEVLRPSPEVKVKVIWYVSYSFLPIFIRSILSKWIVRISFSRPEKTVSLTICPLWRLAKSKERIK